MERSRRIEKKKRVERGYRIVRGLKDWRLDFVERGWLHAILRIDGKKVLLYFQGEPPFYERLVSPGATQIRFVEVTGI